MFRKARRATPPDVHLGDAAGEAAASSAAEQPPVGDDSAEEPDAEVAAAAAAPTQTMKAAGIFGSPVKEGEKSDIYTDDDEKTGEAGEQVLGKGKAKAKGKGKGKGKGTATAAVARRSSRRGQGMAPE